LKTVASQPPDLILLDIRMPQMDGYSVCAALKESPRTREIPIIFLSALGDVSDKVKAFNIGGVDYITKPFQVGEVLARVNNQLNMRQQQQQISALLQQVQQLNTSLEQRIQSTTLELQQALQYEKALKSISDRIRHSLDKTYILQAAVEELTRVLQAQYRDTVLHHPDQTMGTFHFKAESSDRSKPQDTASSLSGLPGIYDQLEQGITVAFCCLTNDHLPSQSAVLGCPIQDDRTWVGTLWLFKPLLAGFSEQEIRLVQQVANQCALALRQARRYQAAYSQIVNLHRLNRLKDDFLSTISHELRTSVSNMRMMLQLLMIVTEQGENFLAQMAESTSKNNRIVHYFKVLQEECERELQLIQNLLDLQRS
ncbi:MAG TPA: response regulator, partial [Allocoleopsis sp.]